MKVLRYRKETDRQFWMGFYKDWFLLWLRNAFEFGSRSEKEVQGTLWNFMKKTID
ncbi:MAG: hypothetical protein JOZ18_13340 [Chloroflexi bacterium]|nr:hypothetical protein [Chloroflexota bacterium]